MNSRSTGAFLLSATLHAAVIAIALLLSYASNRTVDETVKVFELVAGEGTDFMAKEAPALGVAGGIKINVPQPPAPRPAAPEPKAPEPAITPAPEPPPPVQPAPKPAPAPVKKITPAAPKDLDQKFKQDIAIARRNAARQLERERRAAEKKRQEEERKEKARMSKEEFDRQNRSKTRQVASAGKSASLKKIDVEGIAGGVDGGSSASKAGARGTALKSDNDDVLAAYRKFFTDELRRHFEPPPGLADSLQAEIEVRNNPDGSLSGARVVKSSGVKQFDDEVLAAIRRVKLPARPDRKSETFSFVFTMRDKGEG